MVIAQLKQHSEKRWPFDLSVLFFWGFAVLTNHNPADVRCFSGWVKTSIYRLRWLGPHSTNQYEAHFIRVPNRQSAFFFICEVVAFPRTCHDHLCCTPGRVQHATLQWTAGSCGTISGGSNRTQEHRGPKRGAPWWFRFMLNKMWLEY